ncbi:MAG: pseudouridine synthase, partial [Terracidiphilus sp.]
APVRAPILDPLGDTTDGEGRFIIELIPGSVAEAEMAAFRAEIAEEAEEDAPIPVIGGDEPEEEEPAAPLPAPKLERLQKILSQAGIASRRRAEEMIVAGQVVVNGQVVTTLGSKADPAHDHIRVDGKLLHGAERHRYFMLNKPKGYVTTVSDPEGRPTVMEFVAKLGQRLYPVGRLDYQSEGLLLMTNDGELANGLTRAASGVEKTYLVKVAGQPSEEELDKLRGGVSIESGEAGSSKVRTAPARVHQVRQGDNPWYEVVLIEGRNRELRKMFSAVGHFVEKIRRVGYGPLILDLEPGKLRELDAEEVAALRLAAEGKLKPRRAKTAGMLPRDASRAARPRATEQSTGGRGTGDRGTGDRRTGDRHSSKPFARGERPFRPKQGPPGKSEWKPRREGSGGGPANRSAGRGERPPQQFKPRFDRPPQQDRPRFDRPSFPARPHGEPGAFRPRPDRGESRPSESRRGESHFDRPRPRPFAPRGDRPGFARPEAPGRNFERRPESGRGKPPGKSFGGPAKSWNKRPDSRPFRSEGAAQPFREKARGEFAPGHEERPAGRPQRSFGPKPGGFSKPGFKPKFGGPTRSGQRPGPRPGGRGSGGKKRG